MSWGGSWRGSSRDGIGCQWRLLTRGRQLRGGADQSARFGAGASREAMAAVEPTKAIQQEAQPTGHELFVADTTLPDKSNMRMPSGCSVPPVNPLNDHRTTGHVRSQGQESYSQNPNSFTQNQLLWLTPSWNWPPYWGFSKIPLKLTNFMLLVSLCWNYQKLNMVLYVLIIWHFWFRARIMSSFIYTKFTGAYLLSCFFHFSLSWKGGSNLQNTSIQSMWINHSSKFSDFPCLINY